MPEKKSDMRLGEVMEILRSKDPSTYAPVPLPLIANPDDRSIPLPKIRSDWPPPPMSQDQINRILEQRGFSDQEAWDILRGMGR